MWSHEGKAELEHKRQSIGKDLVLKHEGASNSVNDFLYANTMFSNGGGEPIGHTSTTRHCHLGHDLVPYNSFSPHSELRPVDGPRPAMPGQHSPPGRRLSAIEFDDGLSHSRVLSQRPPPSSQHTPERGGRASLDQRLGTHHNAPAASPGGRSRGPPTLYTAAGPHHFPSDMIPTEVCRPAHALSRAHRLACHLTRAAAAIRLCPLSCLSPLPSIITPLPLLSSCLIVSPASGRCARAPGTHDRQGRAPRRHPRGQATAGDGGRGRIAPRRFLPFARAHRRRVAAHLFDERIAGARRS